jgi:KEOPS complex subunit Cgi121
MTKLLPFQVSQHSIVLVDKMKISPGRFEIRQARMTVDNRSEFLRTIQSIAREYSTYIICFNADNMAGHRHVKAALHYAHRSFFSGKSISNSFEMEALLFAAGSRQCNTASLFGIHEHENAVFVCSCPVNGKVWEELSHHMHFVSETWEDITPEKEERLKSFFSITREELALVGSKRIVDLVLERLALLEVYR